MFILFLYKIICEFRLFSHMAQISVLYPVFFWINEHFPVFLEFQFLWSYQSMYSAKTPNTTLQFLQIFTWTFLKIRNAIIVQIMPNIWISSHSSASGCVQITWARESCAFGENLEGRIIQSPFSAWCDPHRVYRHGSQIFHALMCKCYGPACLLIAISYFSSGAFDVWCHLLSIERRDHN